MIRYLTARHNLGVFLTIIAVYVTLTLLIYISVLGTFGREQLGSAKLKQFNLDTSHKSQRHSLNETQSTNVFELSRHREIGIPINLPEKLRNKKRDSVLPYRTRSSNVTWFPFFSRPTTVRQISCSKLFEGNTRELLKAEIMMTKVKKTYYPIIDYTRLLDRNHCSNFIQSRGYVTDTLTDKEENFPIAYSILLYRNPEQAERLLRSIYRPQNFYCIHVDRSADAATVISMKAIAGCFSNVFMASRSVKVVWGEYSVLEPELICLEDLWKYSKWKYFINLTGQEFPIRTNYELVEIFRTVQGANFVEAIKTREYLYRYTPRPPPPHNIKLRKGAVHVAVSRGFVDYILHNETAQHFLNWTKNTYIPDETFFSSLNHNPHLGIPGAYKGEPFDDIMKPFLVRYKVWDYSPWPCMGRVLRNICIMTVANLPGLQHRVEFFVNKFFQQYQWLALDCLEEWHFNRTRNQYLGQIPYDTSYFQNIAQFKNKI